MIRGAIIFYLVNYCAILFSQSPVLSRNFPASRKSIPLHILNNNPRYFYLLRYNKEVHDLVVERRSKPTAEILSFTPLRMDSVNARWFDYERLDYLFFEAGRKVFYLFERVLNEKKSLYLRAVDTTGKASGFILLAEQLKDPTTRDIHFEFKVVSPGRILIILSMFDHNGSAKKKAILYDVLKRERIWTKQLPDISDEAVFSSGFTCSKEGDLFYYSARLRFLEFRREYRSQMQLQVPAFACEGVTVTGLSAEDSLHHYPLQIPLLYRLQDLSIIPGDSTALCVGQYSAMDAGGKEQVRIFNCRISQSSGVSAPTESPLGENIDKSLTYYDGTDFNAAADKNFKMGAAVLAHDSLCYIFSERENDHFYNEVLCFGINPFSAKVLSQAIVPRKIYFSKEQILFKNIGFVHHQRFQDKLYSFVLENRGNQKKDPGTFKFHAFVKQSYLRNGSLVAYCQEQAKAMHKKVIFTSGDLDVVPLKYEGTQPDLIFYLNKPKAEKFASVSLNQL